MKTVCVDFSQLTSNSGGYVRYCQYLSKAIIEYSELEGVLLKFFIREGEFDFVKLFLDEKYLCVVYRDSSIYNAIRRELLAFEYRNELWVFPGNLSTLNLPRKFLLVVHDLKFLQLPDSVPFLKRLWRKWYVKHGVLHANKVVAISEFTNNSIVKAYGDSVSHKVCTIKTAAEFGAGVGDLVGCNGFLFKDKPFFLSVLTSQSHKNAETIIEVFRQRVDDTLVLVSRSRFENIPPNVIVLSDISDSELGWLYANAIAFLFPSLYEGQGLPVVEAVSHGCWVVCTKLSVLCEMTFGEATFIEDPKSIKEWTHALNSLQKTGECYDDIFLESYRNIFSENIMFDAYVGALREVSE